MEKEVRRSSLDDIRKAMAHVIEMAQPVRQVYAVACGGSNGAFYPMEYFLREEARTFGCTSISANEFAHAVPRAMDENSIVFVMSLGGSTPETCAAAERAKRGGAAVVALVADPEAELAKTADSTIVFQIETDYCASHSNVFTTLWCGIELLEQIEGYQYYKDALDAAGKIDGICRRAIEQAAARADRWGKKNAQEKIVYTVASGPSAKVAYTMSICMLMEMEWVDSASIHSGEFFHGPFEVTDKDKSFMVFESVGRTRPLDERVLRFLERYGDRANIEVLDAKELGIDTLQDSVAEYFCPVLHWLVALAYSERLAFYKEHPLFMRRYMGKVNY